MRTLACLFAILLTAISLSLEAREFSSDEERVLQAYLAYYGRPADPGRLEYWSNRLRDEGGDLNSIIDAFGQSQEYQDRFGSLSNTQLVTNLYRQLFSRNPDSGGLSYYVELLDSGDQNLQRISLSILDGSQNEDIAIIKNRTAFSRHYIEGSEDGVIQALDAQALADLMSSIGESEQSLQAGILEFYGGEDGLAGGSLDGSYRLVRGSVFFNDGTLIDSAGPGFTVSGTMTINGSSLSQSIDLEINNQRFGTTLSAGVVDAGHYLTITDLNTLLRNDLIVVQRGIRFVTEINANPGGGDFSEVDYWVKLTGSAGLARSSAMNGIESQSYQALNLEGGMAGSLVGELIHTMGLRYLAK